MLRDERLDFIEAFVEEKKYVTQAELMERLHVSRATIHRDLDFMKKNNRIDLTRGGAVWIKDKARSELSYMEKRKTNHDEKSRIGIAASKHVQSGDAIMIDSGTTCYEIAEHLDDVSSIYAATNDLMTAVRLAAYTNFELISIGGTVRPGYYVATGQTAASEIGRYMFDVAFVSTDSVSLDRGLTITNADEVEVKQKIIQSAKEAILVCDHHKFSVSAFVQVCPIHNIHTIITGKDLDPEIAREYMECGIKLELV